MSTLRQFMGHIKLQWWGKQHIVGWRMTPAQAQAFFAQQKKMVLTFFGYSASYEDEARKKLGKPIQFFPAEVNHQWLIRRAQSNGLPPPQSFRGAAHEVFGKKP